MAGASGSTNHAEPVSLRGALHGTEPTLSRSKSAGSIRVTPFPMSRCVFGRARGLSRNIRRSARRDAHDGPSAARADQGDRRSVGNARSSSRIEGVERPTYFVRGLACSLVVLGQAMFWCVGTFQDSRPIPRSLVRRTGAPARRIRLPARRPGWRRAGLPVSEPAGASGY